MKVYDRNPKRVMVAQWDGTATSPLIAELNAAGWYTQILDPDSPTIPGWDEDGKTIEMPTPPQLVIVGLYRNQIYRLDADAVFIVCDGDKVNTWLDPDSYLGEYTEVEGEDVRIPTPHEVFEASNFD